MTPPPQSAAIGTIIAHQDLAPWNLVIGDRWAFIDWDTAAPGTRLWDLAYAVHGFVPLSADPGGDGLTPPGECGSSSTPTASTRPSGTVSSPCWLPGPNRWWTCVVRARFDSACSLASLVLQSPWPPLRRWMPGNRLRRDEAEWMAGWVGVDPVADRLVRTFQ